MFEDGLITSQNSLSQQNDQKNPSSKIKINQQTIPSLSIENIQLNGSFMCSYFGVRCLKEVATHPHSFVTNGHKPTGAVPPCSSSQVPGRTLEDIPDASRQCREQFQAVTPKENFNFITI